MENIFPNLSLISDINSNAFLKTKSAFLFPPLMNFIHVSGK